MPYNSLNEPPDATNQIWENVSPELAQSGEMIQFSRNIVVMELTAKPTLFELISTGDPKYFDSSIHF